MRGPSSQQWNASLMAKAQWFKIINMLTSSTNAPVAHNELKHFCYLSFFFHLSGWSSHNTLPFIDSALTRGRPVSLKVCSRALHAYILINAASVVKPVFFFLCVKACCPTLKHWKAGKCFQLVSLLEWNYLNPISVWLYVCVWSLAADVE